MLFCVFFILPYYFFIGKQTRHRRSDYIEWNYNAELVAFAARLGENFDDSKLREAFITTDFVEAEISRQFELQIEVNLTTCFHEFSEYESTNVFYQFDWKQYFISAKKTQYS